MRKDYEKLFTNLTPKAPPSGLFGKIISRIQRERQFLTMRNRLIVLSLGVVASFLAFIPAFNAVQSDFAQSGIMNFVSLLSYDFMAVIAVWNDFALSILESLPIVSITIFFTVTFVFLLSVKILMQDISSIFTKKSFN